MADVLDAELLDSVGNTVLPVTLTRATGPRTLAGKARSSMNALRHGLASTAVVLPGEDGTAWGLHRDAVVADLGAVGYVQCELAERVALLLWRQRRAAAAESAVARGVWADAERVAVRDAIAREVQDDDAPEPLSFDGIRSLADLSALAVRARAMLAAWERLTSGGRGDEKLVRDVAPFYDVLVVARWAVLREDDAAPDGAVMFVQTPRDARESLAAMARWCSRYRTEPGRLTWAVRPTIMDTLAVISRVEAEARRRLAVAQATAATTERVAQVHRHENHIARQLSAALAELRALQG